MSKIFTVGYDTLIQDVTDVCPSVDDAPDIWGEFHPVVMEFPDYAMPGYKFDRETGECYKPEVPEGMYWDEEKGGLYFLPDTSIPPEVQRDELLLDLEYRISLLELEVN